MRSTRSVSSIRRTETGSPLLNSSVRSMTPGRVWMCSAFAQRNSNLSSAGSSVSKMSRTRTRISPIVAPAASSSAKVGSSALGRFGEGGVCGACAPAGSHPASAAPVSAASATIRFDRARIDVFMAWRTRRARRVRAGKRWSSRRAGRARSGTDGRARCARRRRAAGTPR